MCRRQHPLYPPSTSREWYSVSKWVKSSRHWRRAAHRHVRALRDTNQGTGLKVGLLNDICVALQYLLAIPIALALHQVLRVYQPGLMRAATIIGIASMLVVVGLQLLLIFQVLPFEQQVAWHPGDDPGSLILAGYHWHGGSLHGKNAQ